MKNTVFRVCFASVLLAFAVVILGAFTRLADAGLGCPDWPTCYGHFWVPLSADDVAAANEAFAETPVEHDKTWPEQLHRIFASTLGLMILAIFFLCYRLHERKKPWLSVIALLGTLVLAVVGRIVIGDGLDPYLWVLIAAYFVNIARIAAHTQPGSVPFKLPAALAGLVILQGFFGMWTVTLNLWPQVVTLHLLGGFATLSLLWLLLQRLGQWQWHAEASVVVSLMRTRLLATLVFVAVVVQIALGGWVSSNYAALACPDFPLCQNELWPHARFAKGFNFMQHIGPNYLGGMLESEARIAIHLTHRIGALVVLVLGVLLSVKLWRTPYPQARNMAVVLLVVLAVQITLGVLNIVLSLPLFIAVAHNAVGAVLLLTVLTINHRIRTAVTL